jgi:Na+/proline symporter
MHTYLEVVQARGWGPRAHQVFLGFALTCNVVVSAMLLLGGSAVIEQLTGLDRTWSSFLIPLGVLVYTYNGGLRATFYTSYFHTCIIFAVLIVFVSTVYRSEGAAPEVGSPATVLGSLWASALAFRRGGGGACRVISDCHFRKTATEYDRKPAIKWLSCTAK